MAVVNQDNSFNSQNEDEKNAGNSTPPSFGQASGTSSVGGTASTPAPSGTKSGSFTNISNYLKANSGYNANNGGFAGQVAGNISKENQNVQGNINNSVNQFQTDANTNRNQYDQNFVNNTLSNVGNLSDSDASKFNTLASKSYTGPTNLENASDLQNQAQNVQQQAQQTQSEAGRFNLLRNMFSNPSYSQGQQSLDNLLLQAQPGAAQQFGQVLGQTNKLGNQLTTQQAQAAGQAQQYTNEAANTQKQALGALGTAVTGFDTANQTQATNLNNQNTAQYNQMLQDVKNGTVSSAEAAQLGIGAGSGTYGLDLSQYIQNAPTATAQNSLSADQYAQLQGLQKLAGTYNLGDASNALAQYQGVAGAGTATQGPVINTSQLGTDLGQKQQGFNQSLSTFANQINNAPATTQSGNTTITNPSLQKVDTAALQRAAATGDTNTINNFISGITNAAQQYANQPGVAPAAQAQLQQSYLSQYQGLINLLKGQTYAGASDPNTIAAANTYVPSNQPKKVIG